MSCNGCRVLRRGCSEKCVLRPCLTWIDTPQAQSHATLFVSKFFGRSDLIAFISAVPDAKKPALFQSLLYEACGRTVNPVNGAVGLLYTGNWHVIQTAVETVLSGGTLRPLFGVGVLDPNSDESSEAFRNGSWRYQGQEQQQYLGGDKPTPLLFAGLDDQDMTIGSTVPRNGTGSPSSEMSELTAASFGSDGSDGMQRVGGKQPKLLNLFYN